jgi:hypothetical protein
LSGDEGDRAAGIKIVRKKRGEQAGRKSAGAGFGKRKQAVVP